MTVAARTLKKLPSLTSFTRRSISSDAALYSLFENREPEPALVIRHGIRGTQNVNGEKKKPSKDGIEEVSNVQITETAKTAPDAIGFQAEFAFRPLSLHQGLNDCRGTDSDIFLEDHYYPFVNKAIHSEGLSEVSRRMARNILNARWLWRNRGLGTSITVNVSGKDGEEDVSLSADALNISLNHFDDYTDSEHRLGEILAKGFSGKSLVTLTIVAQVKMGFKGSVELHPSENYVNSKPKGFSRALYKLTPRHNVYARSENPDQFEDTHIMGHAAIRDQKVGNALRTIDTWYAGFEANQGRPIAVEPEGASLSSGCFFRHSKDKNAELAASSAFRLATRMGTIDPDSNEGMFMIAALIRAGVYGESDK